MTTPTPRWQFDYFAPDLGSSIRKTLQISLLAHVVVFSLGVLSPFWLPKNLQELWGTGSQLGETIRVGTVRSLPDFDLAPPERTTESKIASDSKAIHRARIERPEVKLDRKIIEIPTQKKINEWERRPSERHLAQLKPAEENVVPTEQPTAPSFRYGSEFSVGSSQGGVSFGDGGFGSQYAWYARAVQDRISSNFLQNTVDVNIRRAPRVQIGFDILRDGAVSGVRILSSSGIPSLDRAAERAIYASTPFNPLPTGYAGSKVAVECWFDFRR